MDLRATANRFFGFLDKHYLNIAFTFFFIFLLLILVIRIAIVFCYHGQLGGIDNNFDYPVMRLLKSLTIYPDPEDYPFAVNPYAPLLFYISGAVCQLTGIEAGDGIQIYFVTRGVCLCCDLITMYMLYRVMRTGFAIDKLIAGMGALAFFYLVSYWGYTLNRSDSMVLMWFGVIMYVLFCYAGKPSLVQMLILAVLCNLAIFSKQNAIITPAFVGALLLYNRQWKLLFSFLGFFLLLFTGSLFLFTNLYSSGNFAAHLVYALNNRIDFRWYYINIFKALLQGYMIIPFSAGLYLAFRWVFTSSNRTLGALSLITLLVTGWSLGLALKWGSHIGYLHESLFCSTILLAYVLTKTTLAALRQKLVLPALFGLLFIFSNSLLQLFFYFLNDRAADKQLYTHQKEISDHLLKEVAGTDKYVFAYTDYYNDFFKVLLQDKAVLPNTDAVACCTMPDGNFNYSKLKEGFENGRIEFIITEGKDIQNTFVTIPLTRYKPIAEMHGYIIMRYQP
jgi:hypothetical protein